MKLVTTMMLVVFWCGLIIPSFAHAETSEPNLLCSIFGWVVQPIGFCKEEIIPEILPSSENSEPNFVNQGSVIPTPFSPTEEILEVRPIEHAESSEPKPVPVTIVKEYVTVNGDGVSEAYVDQRIRELLMYINSFPRTSDLLTMDRNPSELVDANDFVTREYIYKTLDKVDNQIDNAIENLESGLTFETTFTSPTLVDAILNGTTYVNGRLGLGTSSPSDLLAIEGAVYLAETNPTQVDDRLYNFGGDLYWNGSVVTSAALGNWSASGGDVFRPTGNVGVGTSSPYAKLSVTGDLALTGGLFDSTATRGTNGQVLRSTGTGVAWTSLAALALTTSDVSEGANLYWTNSRFDTRLSATTSLPNITTLEGLTDVGTITTGTWAADEVTAFVTGGGNIAAVTGIVSGGALTPNTAKSIHASNALTGLGINEWYGLYVDSGSLASKNYGVYIQNQGVGTDRFALYVAGTTDKSYFGGNVGIGTTSPYAKLSVVGSVVADSYTALSTTATSTFAAGVNVGTGNGYFIGGNNVLSGSTAGGIVGFGNTNTSSGGVAIGISNSLTGFEGTAIGTSNITSSTIGTAIGYGNTASDFFTTAVGYSNTASAINGVAFGYGNTASASGAVAIGANIDNSIADSLMLGPSDSAKLTILSSGNVGIGTTTPASKLDVVNGNTRLIGSATGFDSPYTLSVQNNAPSTWIEILNSGGSGNGAFLGLNGNNFELYNYQGGHTIFLSNDTERMRITNIGNVGIGTTTPNSKLTVAGDIDIVSNGGISFGSTRYLYASSTNESVVFGENAGVTFNSSTAYNVALGFEAGQYASTSATDFNNFMGYQAGKSNTSFRNNIFGLAAGYQNSGSRNNLFGESAGSSNTGSYSNLFGPYVGQNNTGSYSNLLGYAAGFSNTGSHNNLFGNSAGYSNIGSYNNMFGSWAGYFNTGSYNEMIGFDAGYNLQSTSSIIIGAQAFRGGAGSSAFQAINNVALGYRAGYAAQTGGSNNILLGYQAADNLTTGNNNIVIGYDVDLTTATADNTLNIGNLIFGTGLDGTGTTLASGNVGIGTTSPSSKLSVAGGFYLTGAFKDSTNAAGTLGQILSSTGAATVWTSTSSLGLGNGTFLGLSDTPSSYTANRLMFTNSGGTALIDSASLVFDGTNFGIGSSTPGSRLSISGNSYLVGGATNTDVAMTVQSGNILNAPNLQNWRKYDGTLVASILGTGGLAVNRSSAGGYSHFGPDATDLAPTDSIDSLVAVKNDTLGVGTHRALTAIVEFSAPMDSVGNHFGLNGFAYMQSDNNLTSSLATGAGGLSGGRYAIRIGSGVTASPLVSLATGVSSGFTDSSSVGVATISDLALFNVESTTVYNSNITNQSGLRVMNASDLGGTITNQYGVYVDNLTSGTNNYSIYAGTAKSYFGGNVGIGTTSPYAKLSVVGSVVADSYSALSTTATSTFAAGVNVDLGNGYFIGGYKVISQDASNNFVAGIQNTATGFTSNAIGSFNSVSSVIATAIGFANIANNINATAIGNQNTASSSSATAIGFGNNVSASGAVAVGNGVSNLVANSLMIGPSDSSKLTILSNGNVGIGTSSPWAKLAVQNTYGSQTTLFDVATTTTAGFATSSIFSVAASGEVKIKSVNTSVGLFSPNLLTIASTSGNSMVSVSPFGRVNINRGDITNAEFGSSKQSSLNVQSVTTAGTGFGGYYDTANRNISSVFTYNPAGDDSEYYASNLSRLIFGGVGNSSVGSVSASINSLQKTNTGTAEEVNGVISLLDLEDGVTNNAFGINSQIFNYNTVSNSVQNAYGVYSSIDGIASFNDVITNAYGLYTNFDLNNITNAYAIYTNGLARSYFGGSVGIGTTSPYAELSVVGDVVADSYTALSTTSTSTFAAGVNIGSGSGYFVNENLALSGAVGSDTVIGFGNTVSVSGLAIGNSNTASALNSVALGRSNSASSLGAVSVGYINTASSLFASAVGYVNSATSSGATALGYINNAGGVGAVAIGNSNNAYAAGSIAIGRSITNTITDSLQIGPSNTAKLTILSTGNYGIGTTSPNAKLNIYSNVTTNGQIGGLSTDLVSSSLAGGAVYGNKTTLSSIGGVPPDTSVYLNHAASNVSCFGCGLVRLYGNYVSFVNDNSNTQKYGFYADSANSAYPIKAFFANLDDNSTTVGYTASSTASFSGNYLNFTKGNSTVLTVKGSGNVGIGTSTPAKALQVIGDIRTGTTGTNGCIENFAGTALAGTCSSDETLKKDIVPIGSVLSRLAQITPSTFYWNDLAASTLQNSTDTINYGLVAQDVAPVFPDMVSVTSSGYLGVNYSMLPILTLQGLLDMNAMVESLSSTTAPLTDAAGEKTFVGKFFDRLSVWFADRANGIQDLFANRVRTKTLCIGDETEGETCITKDQLDKLLLEATSGSGNQSASVSIPTEPTETQAVAISTDTEAATSTVSEESPAENVVEEVVPEQTEETTNEEVVTELLPPEEASVETEVLPVAEDPGLIE